MVSGLEQNGQVTGPWPSPPHSCNSLPVVPPLPEISLKRTNRRKMALDALGGGSGDWGHQGLMEQWLELRVPSSCALPSPCAFSPCMQPPHSFVASSYIQPRNSCFTPFWKALSRKHFICLRNSPPQQLPSASFSLLTLIVFLFFPNSELARLPLSSLDCNTGLLLITLAWPCSFPIATVTNYYKVVA